MAAVAVGDAKARAEGDLARVQEDLAVAEEVRLKVEAKAACLKVERTSLLLEIRAAKDELSSLQAQEGKDK